MEKKSLMYEALAELLTEYKEKFDENQKHNHDNNLYQIKQKVYDNETKTTVQ